MKLFIDEDLTPALALLSHGRGYDATASRDRGMLGRPDREVAQLCFEEDRVLVTANEGDFRLLSQRSGLHPGLVTVPSVSRQRQLILLDAALDFIERRASEAGVRPAAFMVNRVVEVEQDGACADFELP